MIRPLIAWLTALFVATTAAAATGIRAGGLTEFKVELPDEARRVAGRGQLSPVTHALVTIAAPANFDTTRDWPVMVISATTDPQYHSSRRLLREYAGVALADGWILVAADPSEEIALDTDGVALRYALNSVALSALRLQWPNADRAPLAFGGFSGGAKISGWLAAGFAGQGRKVIGIYLAGVNEETLVPAARAFNVLNDAFRRIPVFLQSGEKDEVATPADHRRIQEELKQSRFENVWIEYFPGSHDVEPELLRTALDWFRELAPPRPSAR